MGEEGDIKASVAAFPVGFYSVSTLQQYGETQEQPVVKAFGAVIQVVKADEVRE